MRHVCCNRFNPAVRPPSLSVLMALCFSPPQPSHLASLQPTAVKSLLPAAWTCHCLLSTSVPASSWSLLSTRGLTCISGVLSHHSSPLPCSHHQPHFSLLPQHPAQPPHPSRAQPLLSNSSLKLTLFSQPQEQQCSLLAVTCNPQPPHPPTRRCSDCTHPVTPGVGL